MNKRPNNASMLVLQVYDISISMNKHVCNFVLREGKKGEKKKKKDERTCYIWMESIYILRKGGKLRFHGIPRKIKKKKKRIKFVIRLEKKSCPFDDESDIEPNSV